MYIGSGWTNWATLTNWAWTFNNCIWEEISASTASHLTDDKLHLLKCSDL